MTGICGSQCMSRSWVLLCRPVGNPYDETVLFSSLQEALGWVPQMCMPEVGHASLRRLCSAPFSKGTQNSLHSRMDGIAL